MGDMIKTKKEKDFSINLEEMVKAGLHFGHKTSNLHPKMKPYIFGIRKTVHLIDLGETAGKLKEALIFIGELVSEGKVILLVDTKAPHQELIREIAQECKIPYVVERWIGGSLTNFSVIKKRIAYLKELREKTLSADSQKYTKKERLDTSRELQKLELKFGGIESLDKTPDALFICDIKKDDLALKEAKMKGIPVIAIVDTNADPGLVDCAIPANDDAISSVRYILEKVKDIILNTELKNIKAEDVKSDDKSKEVENKK